MEFEDRLLRCVECGTEFVWTAGEQRFYANKNLRNEPRRCRDCKAKRPAPAQPAAAARGPVETPATCAGCGQETTVPFRPTQGRPVFCRDCFEQRRAARSPA